MVGDQRVAGNMAAKKEESLRWIKDEQLIHTTSGYGQNLKSVTDNLADQKERQNVVKSYSKTVSSLPGSDKESVQDSYNTLEYLSEKRAGCLENISQIAQLENSLGKLSVEVSNTASSLVADEKEEQLPENVTGGTAAAAQKCVLGVRDNWQWIRDLVSCADIHLQNASDYHQFFHEIKEYTTWMPVQLQGAQEKVKIHEKTEGSGAELQRWLLDLKELLALFLNWQGRVEKLFDRSKKIVPVHLRNEKMEYFRPVESLTNYETNKILVKKGEELLLTDNSDPESWQVRNFNHTETHVPSVICLIPGPHPDAIQAAMTLRLQLLTEWTLNVKRVGKSIILFTILVLKDFNEDELNKLKAMSPENKKAVLASLQYIEETLAPYWKGYAGYDEMQSRIEKLRKVLAEKGDAKFRDEKFENQLVDKVKTEEELLRSYMTFWSQWEAYKIIVETSRHADHLLIVDKWEQLKFISMEELRKLWQQGLTFGDGDNLTFEEWLKLMKKTWNKTHEDEEALRRKAEEEERKRKEEEERKRKEAEERKRREEEERRRKEEAERKRREEEERKRIEEEERRRKEEEERKRKEEEERKRREEEERKRMEEERKRLEEEKRKLEEEKRRMEEERKRKAEEERKRKEEEERKRREEEERKRKEEEERLRLEEEERIRREEEERINYELETTIERTKETTTSDSMSTAEHHEERKFVITGIVDPRSGYEVSMQDAVKMGIINNEEGTYVNPRTGFSVPIPQAMNEGNIKGELQLVKKSEEKKTDIGLITITTQRESRPYTIQAVMDAKTDKRMSIDEAINNDIIDQMRNIYKNTLTNKDMSLSDALESGHLVVKYDETESPPPEPEIVTITYAVYWAKDQLRNSKPSFSQAVKEGLLNTETGQYFNNSTGEYVKITDAIKKGDVKATVVKDIKSLDIDPRNIVVVEAFEKAKANLKGKIPMMAALRKFGEAMTRHYVGDKTIKEESPKKSSAGGFSASVMPTNDEPAESGGGFSASVMPTNDEPAESGGGFSASVMPANDEPAEGGGGFSASVMPTNEDGTSTAENGGFSAAVMPENDEGITEVITKTEESIVKSEVVTTTKSTKKDIRSKAKEIVEEVITQTVEPMLMDKDKESKKT